MNLAEIANNACLRFVRQDTATQTLAKAYVRQRYEMLWDAHNWRQSLITATVPVAAGTAEVTVGAGIERTLGVRWGDRLLDGIDHGTAMRLLPENFDAAGEPLGYIDLPLDSTMAARLRLVQIPQTDGTLYVLAKRRCPGLPDDTSVPVVAGIGSALVAYVLADLWSYEGQESKAAAKAQEAGQLAQRALAAEIEASGVRPRLIPYQGIADGLNDY